MNKHLSLLLATVSFCFYGYGQSSHSNTEIVPIYENQKFYLNGGNRAMMGGDSRICLKVELPANTIDWYYAFSTASSEEEATQSIQLAAQLTRLADPTGATAAATNALLSPTGSSTCNVYLTDKENAELFDAKTDKYGGEIKYYNFATRENFREGVVEIDENITGTIYLCFKNPSATTGVAVTLDVVAIVKSAETERAESLGTMGWQAYERGEIDRCLELSQQALSLDNSLSWVHFNIGLVHLIQQRNDKALNAYLDAISMAKKSNAAKYYFRAAVEDIQNAGLEKSDQALEIVELLAHEFNNQ